jgi:hypothetical protein
MAATIALQKPLSISLSLLLVLVTTPLRVGAQEPASTETSGYSGQGAPLSAEELQQLVAPIALYPDALVAQVLGAATFPDEIPDAASWLQQHSSLTGNNLVKAVDEQPWDPSVKALTQFPTVLGNLGKNLSWTSALGEAYHTQSAEVMAAVQVLRAKALAAGNLKSGPQIKVVTESPRVVVIQPVNPQVVYVPMYNPAVVYGYPYVTPGYSTATVVAAGAIAFGAGIAIGAMMSGGPTWGYSYWNCNWHSTTVVYRGGAYYGNAAWHGGYYGSSRSVYGVNGAARYGVGYNPSTGTYARGATVATPYGKQSVGQAYNPRTGAYGQTHQGSNAYGSWGSSTVSKNGNTAYSQHQTTSQGTTGSMKTSNGASAYGASGKYNSAAVGQAANGDKYAAANGNTYKNTGSGWQNSSGQKSGASGWGGQPKSSGSSAFGGSGGGGWGSRSDSARGSSSMGGGGGWGGGGGRGRR